MITLECLKRQNEAVVVHGHTAYDEQYSFQRTVLIIEKVNR